MTLADFYLADPRLVLVPIEHLGPTGMSRAFAELVIGERGWTTERVALFDASFATYWARSARLAAQTRTWMPPRVRHVAVITDPTSVRPYVQLLNTSAWMLYASDVDPEASHVELLAYLFAHGDRMALTGEVTLPALHNALWWLERTDDECAAFAGAARRATRPDAPGLVAIADALTWLRRLRHETVHPPLGVSPHRAIPGTGLLVPRSLEDEPRVLVDAWTAAARASVEAYRGHWRASPDAAITRLVGWLAQDAPPLLVTAERGRILWDPEHADRAGALRTALKRGDAEAVDSIAADLAVVTGHTRRFLAALANPDALPPPASDTEQTGYSFLHRDRRLIAYDLDERGMERLCGPALPYARAMLGARTVHEWAHLAVDAGWVPCRVDAGELAVRQSRLAALLDETITALPRQLRSMTAQDVAAAGGGRGLARLFLARISDFQANLLAQRFLDRVEIETYVRHNIRSLRFEYPPQQLFRMLIRYLFELQYLRFSAIHDARTFLVASTWFDADFFATGMLDSGRFAALAEAAAAICDGYAVDESRFVAASAR